MKTNFSPFAVLIICFLFSTISISSQKSSTSARLVAARFPQITPSTVVEDLAARKQQNPEISAQELADYGNELLKQQGFNFYFDTCDIAEVNNQKSSVSDLLIPYNYKLKDLNGKTQTYQIMNEDFGHPCGCRFDIPIYQISEKEMTLRVDGKSVVLKRPKKFILDKAELVDEKLKTLRKWYLPLDVVPFGISLDGTKIYIDFTYDDGHEPLTQFLALEISENGNFQYVTKDNPNILKNGVDLENFPKDRNNDYLGYIRFNFGKTSYIVKFSYPCT
jgi:hypothetical protein